MSFRSTMFINNAYVHNNSNDRTAWWSGGPRIRPGVVKQMEVLEESLTLVPRSLIVYSLWHNLFIKRFKCKEFQIRVRDLEKVGYLIFLKKKQPHTPASSRLSIITWSSCLNVLPKHPLGVRYGYLNAEINLKLLILRRLSRKHQVHLGYVGPTHLKANVDWGIH